VGVIGTHRCNSINGRFSYGLYVEPEARRLGYAREAILLLLRYYFDQLRYQKANVTVYDFNAPSLRLHEDLGFTEEGRLRRMIFNAGAYHDEVHFGITVEEFRAKHDAWLSHWKNEERNVRRNYHPRRPHSRPGPGRLSL
jgi:RimJ/RimL family protein N-acetyltransferase